MIRSKQLVLITTRYLKKTLLCKHCIYVDLKDPVLDNMLRETRKKDMMTHVHHGCNKSQSLNVQHSNTVEKYREPTRQYLGILKRVTESRKKILVILHSISHD